MNFIFCLKYFTEFQNAFYDHRYAPKRQKICSVDEFYFLLEIFYRVSKCILYAPKGKINCLVDEFYFLLEIFYRVSKCIL
jgi:hypothetical protein